MGQNETKWQLSKKKEHHLSCDMIIWQKHLKIYSIWSFLLMPQLHNFSIYVYDTNSGDTFLKLVWSTLRWTQRDTMLINVYVFLLSNTFVFLYLK